MAEDAFEFDLNESDVAPGAGFVRNRRGRPVPSTIAPASDEEILRCTFPSVQSPARAAALCLPVELPRVGCLKLQTSLLPPRDEPYELLLELARERIRFFIAKCEDWQMFEPSRAPKAMRRFDEAREALARAVLETDHEAAMTLARTALIAAIDAGEKLAVSCAELMLRRRFGLRPATGVTLGVRIDPRNEPVVADARALASFDAVMVETPWAIVEPAEGELRFDALDRWVQWSVSLRKPLVLGPLLSADARALPEWVRVFRHDYETLRDAAWNFMEAVVERYGEHVSLWCLASGVQTNAELALDAEQMIDLTRRASVLVRQRRPSAKVIVELDQVFDDDLGRHPDGMSALEYAVRLLDEGVHVDVIGLRLLFGRGGDGRETRDLLQFSDALDRYSQLERRVVVTGFGVPSASNDGGGSWHGGWCAQTQMEWATSATAIALSKLVTRPDGGRRRLQPLVESVFWEGLRDHPDADVQHAALQDASGVAKPVLARLALIRERLRKPATAPGRPGASVQGAARAPEDARSDSG